MVQVTTFRRLIFRFLQMRERLIRLPIPCRLVAPILGNNKTGTHSDVMNFNINLTPLPTLPSGTYTGTLTIQAQAI